MFVNFYHLYTCIKFILFSIVQRWDGYIYNCYVYGNVYKVCYQWFCCFYCYFKNKLNVTLLVFFEIIDPVSFSVEKYCWYSVKKKPKKNPTTTHMYIHIF